MPLRGHARRGCCGQGALWFVTPPGFERAVAEPDDLADDPTVRAIAAGQLDTDAMNGELIRSAASAHTGDMPMIRPRSGMRWVPCPA